MKHCCAWPGTVCCILASLKKSRAVCAVCAMPDVCGNTQHFRYPSFYISTGMLVRLVKCLVNGTKRM